MNTAKRIPCGIVYKVARKNGSGRLISATLSEKSRFCMYYDDMQKRVEAGTGDIWAFGTFLDALRYKHEIDNRVEALILVGIATGIRDRHYCGYVGDEKAIQTFWTRHGREDARDNMIMRTPAGTVSVRSFTPMSVLQEI